MSFENDTKLDRTQHSKTNASLVAQIDVTVKVNYSSGYYNVNTTFDQELRGLHAILNTAILNTAVFVSSPGPTLANSANKLITIAETLAAPYRTGL